MNTEINNNQGFLSPEQGAEIVVRLATLAPDGPTGALVVTRISIDVLRSARVRLEEYVGPWFPEPLLADPYEDPERAAELADSLSTAALLLLERLSPLERAVFVLREVFGFSFAEIAFRDGEVATLQSLLAADAQLIGDSGGKAPQWATHIVGQEKVAQALAVLTRGFAKIDATLESHDLNGLPGAIFRDRTGTIINTWTLEILDNQVHTIRTVLNPEKLTRLGPPADVWSLIREA